MVKANKKIDEILAIASKNLIRRFLWRFDSCGEPNPHLGPQHPPIQPCGCIVEKPIGIEWAMRRVAGRRIMGEADVARRNSYYELSHSIRCNATYGGLVCNAKFR